MRKVFFVLFIFFLFTATSFAKETVYLKCPEIITEVRSSKGLLANEKLVKGREVDRNFAKIIISKSSSYVSLFQSGYLFHYAFAMLGGLVIILTWFLYY